MDAETDTSTGPGSRLIRRVVKAVEDAYGPGVVPLPGKTTFYKLVDALAAGRHTFGSAVTRRQAANRPPGPFTPTFAPRPGEQVQIDSTPIDVMVLLDNGVTVRADLTIAVDVATRTICAAVLRPVGTKAVDAALLLARMLVPEPMRPGWAQALRMSASGCRTPGWPHIDERMELAAARPVIVPDTIVIDGGKVFVSDTFTRACDRLGVSVQRARPRTPTDKAIVEATFASINTLFCQHVAAYTGPNTDAARPDVAGGVDAPGAAGPARRVAARRLADPPARRAARPAAAAADAVAEREVRRAGRRGRLPAADRCPGRTTWSCCRSSGGQINDYGIRIDYRTYDCPELGALPAAALRRHRDARACGRSTTTPMTLTRVFVRTPDGWVTAPWTHLPMVSAPFADFTWRHARRAGRRPRRGRHQRDRGRPGPRRPAHPGTGRPGGQGQRPGRRPHPSRRSGAPPTAPRRRRRIGNRERQPAATDRAAGHGDPVRGLRRRRRGRTMVNDFDAGRRRQSGPTSR